MSPEAPAAPPGPPGVREATEAWLHHETSKRGWSAGTLRRLSVTARAVARHWEDRLVTTLDRGAYTSFIDAWRAPRCRTHHDGRPCPELADDPGACPAFRGVSDRAVHKLINDLNQFERFLVAQGHVSFNRLAGETWPSRADADPQARIHGLAQHIETLAKRVDRDQRFLVRYRALLAQLGGQP